MKKIWIVSDRFEDQILDICSSEEMARKSANYWHNEYYPNHWFQDHCESAKESGIYYKEFKLDQNLANKAKGDFSPKKD